MDASEYREQELKKMLKFNELTLFGLPVFDSATMDTRETALRVLEEASELCEAAKNLESYEYYIESDYNELEIYRDALLLEFSDVLQTLVNLAYCFSITEDEVQKACDECYMRNYSRGRY